MKNTRKRGAVSLIVVLTIGLMIFSMSISLTAHGLGVVEKNHNKHLTEQSFHTAESAAREGTYQYLKNHSFTSGSVPSENNVSQSNVSSQDFGTHITMTGVGENDTHREVVQKIIVFPAGYAFQYAIYAENDLGLGGNSTIEGNIFANGDIGASGSSDIDGDAYASGVITAGAGHIQGDSSSGVDPIPAPTIDTSDYLTDAMTTGTYFDVANDAETYLNGETRTGVIYSDPGGAVETKIQGAGTSLTGSLVVDGDLQIQGGTITASGNYAAVIVLGDLRVSGGTTIDGIVYVTGSTSFGAGNNTITGSLISAGGVTTDITGNTTVIYDPDISIEWENVTGLEITLESDPEIVWGEE